MNFFRGPIPKAFLILLVFTFSLPLLSAGQSGNSCGVVASMTNGHDSVMTAYSNVTFVSTSTNATSIQFIVNGFSYGANPSLTISIDPGLTVVKLIAANGACRDTLTVYYFYSGTPPTDYHNTKFYFGLANVEQHISDFISLRSGGYLLAADRSNNAFYNLPQRAYLSRIKENGCVEWARMIDCNAFNLLSRITQVEEDVDGSIYLCGVNDNNYAIMMKLDGAGNIIWYKKLTTPGSPNYTVSGFKILPDGGVVISSGTYYNPVDFIVLRLSAAGDIIWEKTLQRSIFYTGYMKHVAYRDGAVYICGQLSILEGTSLYNEGILLKLDAATGQTAWTKKYTVPEGPVIMQDIHFSDTGLIINCITGPGAPNVNTITSLLNLDTSGNVINAFAIAQVNTAGNYGVSASHITPIANKGFYVQSNGSVPLSLQPYISNQTKIARLDSNFNVVWGKSYYGVAKGQYFTLAKGQQEDMALAGNEAGNGVVAYSFSTKIAVKKIDSSGTAPVTNCWFSDWQMGTNPVTVAKADAPWYSDQLSSSVISENYSAPFLTVYPEVRYMCNDYVDSCSFVKLTGPSSVCNLSQIYYYRVHKNKACNQVPAWSMSPGIVVVSQTDTLLGVRFSAFGTYRIRAVLEFSCMPSADSVTIIAASNSVPLQLGNDTAICPGNTLVLNAGSTYASYEWQDGSAAPTLSVSTAGLYHVKVTDYCGNIMRDTINVAISTAAQINAGPDRVKCNNDTLHLDAPGGLINYHWSPSYNISSVSSQHVIINPAADTAYAFEAEISSGCRVFDTIRITVNHSPGINLGPDKAFCTGDSILLNAGAGFASYHWNTGAVASTIYAHTSGNYLVQAIMPNGCASADTVQVLPLYPLPLISSIDKNDGICAGENRRLDAGGGYASYIWSTGDHTSFIDAAALGFYKVIVTDQNGCKGSDSTEIRHIWSNPTGFLADSAFICINDTANIHALFNYNSYLWSTGSQSSVAVINVAGLLALTVTDQHGCTGKDSILVLPKECLRGFYMPAAFSPDANGLNDLLRPVISGRITDYKFIVYNRYGKAMFVSATPNEGWDGKYKGQLQDMGSFVWICTYSSNGGSIRVEKGSAILIR